MLSLSCCSVSVCRWPSTLSTPSTVLQGCFLRPTLLLVKLIKELTIITINRQQRTFNLSTVLFYKPVSLSAVLYFQSNQEQTINRKQIYNRFLRNWCVGEFILKDSLSNLKCFFLLYWAVLQHK